MTVAIRSLVKPWSAEHLDETIVTATNFWQNLQFDLALAAALVVVVWGLIRPRDLLSDKPYRWAGVFLVILALSPLMALSDTLVRPLAKSQYVARTGRRPGHRHHRPVHLVLRLAAARQARRSSPRCARPRRRAGSCSLPSWSWWRSCRPTST